MKRGLFRGLLQSATEGLPIEVREYGATMAETATPEQILSGLRSLLNSEQGITVRSRFCMGDLYNQINRQRGMRKMLISLLTNELGGKTYQLLRTYGWVAAKWPEDQRTDGHNWTWFINNAPGQPIREMNENVTALELVKAERNGSVKIFHFVAKSGRKFVSRVEEDVEVIDVTADKKIKAEAAVSKFFCGGAGL